MNWLSEPTYYKRDGIWYLDGKKVDIKEYARQEIKCGNFDEKYSERNHKRRICVFCGRTIPKLETYYTNFPYPYVTYPSWFACENCFKKEWVCHHCGAPLGHTCDSMYSMNSPYFYCSKKCEQEQENADVCHKR